MRWRKANEPLVKSRREIRAFEIVEEIGDPPLVDSLWHVRMRDQRLGIGGEGEGFTRGVMIDQLPHAHMIASTEQALVAWVPDGEGEIAEQMPWTFLAPLEVGAQDQLAVADRSGFIAQPERRDQYFAIVEAHVGCDGAAARVIGQRQDFDQRLGRGGQQRVPKRDRPHAP